MPSVKLTFVDKEPAWPDLKGREVYHVNDTIEITGLEKGMQSGKPSVAMRIDFGDDQVLLFETSLAMLLTVADALKAKYGDPRNLFGGMH